MTSPDLLIVNPGGRPHTYQSLAATLSAIEPPVWAGLMATFVRRRGFQVEILDANALGLSASQVAERVRDVRPRLVAVVVYGHHPSASTQVMPAAGDICRAIAALDGSQPTVLVGGHVAALPEQTLRDEAATFVAGGEGLYTLTALLEALASPSPRLDRVPGLYYREGRSIAHTAPAALVSALDEEMPGVAWDLLPMDLYRAHNWHTFGYDVRTPYGALYTTLGCPYTCSFCCIQAPFRAGEALVGTAHSYRRWSVDAVVREVDTLVTQYGVQHLKLADEMFVLHPGHVLGLCRALAERRYDLNIWAYARVDTVRPEMMAALRAAGVRWLVIGIESADEAVRADVDKAYHQSLIATTLSRLDEEGIHVLGNYMFGLPEETRTSMQATLDLALALKTPFANFYCAMAYPGSELYHRALRVGWALPSSWSGYAQLSAATHPLPTRHLSSEEVLSFRDAAFQTYFTNPAYLSRVTALFGPPAVAQIAAMTSVPLRRTLLGR